MTDEDYFKYSSERFTWSEEGRVFATCASDLELPPLWAPPSFIMVSAQTGKEVTFNRAGIVRDEEGDVSFWKYQAVGHWFSAHIFND